MILISYVPRRLVRGHWLYWMLGLIILSIRSCSIEVSGVMNTFRKLRQRALREIGIGRYIVQQRRLPAKVSSSLHYISDLYFPAFPASRRVGRLTVRGIASSIPPSVSILIDSHQPHVLHTRRLAIRPSQGIANPLFFSLFRCCPSCPLRFPFWVIWPVWQF